MMTNKPFSYIGEALTADEFVAYVARYDFGSVLPDQIVLHNSANPDASWAPLDTDSRNNWDRNEAGLALDQIKAKRVHQLDAIRDYYRDTNGWSAGPHLFIDDLWIYLFTPMYDIGVHAKEGNSYHDAAGKLHYSIGIETVGYFATHGWPAPMQELLRVAVQALQGRLKTFEIVYKSAPRHQPAAHQGSIAFHRDYNKAECPGPFITPAYAIPILAAPAPQLPPPAPGLGQYQYDGLAVYQRADLTGPLAGHLPAGSVVTIDGVGQAGYAPTAGHLASGLGFVDLRLLRKVGS